MNINQKCDFILIALYELEISGDRGMINAMATLHSHNIETEFNEYIQIKNKLKNNGFANTQVIHGEEFRAVITKKGIDFYKTSSFNEPGVSIESQKS